MRPFAIGRGKNIMNNYKDLTGQRFGMLVVVEESNERIQRKRAWICKCDCGKTHIALGTRLTHGNVHSCGCLRYKKAAEALTTHGKRHTRLYSIWTNMRNRCNLPTSTEYERYGARGIKVCDEWQHDFEAFYNWALSNGYRDDLTLDRKDNDGNYEPSNCRWATSYEQTRNTRNNRMIEYNGKTHCITDWANITGIPCALIGQRIDRLGWSIERALTEPVRKSCRGGKTNG